MTYLDVVAAELSGVSSSSEADGSYYGAGISVASVAWAGEAVGHAHSARSNSSE